MANFEMSSGGLLVPTTKTRNNQYAPVGVRTVKLPPLVAGNGPVLTFWTVRGLIFCCNEENGTSERYTTQTFRPRLRSLEQVLEKMYSSDCAYPQDRQALASRVETLRRILKEAEDWGGPYTPGAAEYHDQCGPKTLAAVSTPSVNPSLPFFDKWS